jgi:PAS domain S-box-containing protein
MLAAILESAEDAIVGIALDGSIELWSRGAERLYGYAAAEVKGHSLCSLLPIYEVPALQAMLGTARDGKIIDCETVERLHKIGSKLSVAVKRTAMRDERGVVTGILESGQAARQKTQDTPSETQLRLLVEQMPVLLWTTATTRIRLLRPITMRRCAESRCTSSTCGKTACWISIWSRCAPRRGKS